MSQGAAGQLNSQDLAFEGVHGYVEVQPRLGLPGPGPHGQDYPVAMNYSVFHNNTGYPAVGALQPTHRPSTYCHAQIFGSTGQGKGIFIAV